MIRALQPLPKSLPDNPGRGGDIHDSYDSHGSHGSHGICMRRQAPEFQRSQIRVPSAAV